MSGRAGMALIVAQPGQFRESLRALIVSILPDICILEADDLAAAEPLVRLLHPSLVVIDGSLQAYGRTPLVKAVQTMRQWARCCVLADSVGQQPSALTAGASVALLKGEPPGRVFKQVEHLLQAD